jgi:hypothetical protein
MVDASCTVSSKEGNDTATIASIASRFLSRLLIHQVKTSLDENVSVVLLIETVVYELTGWSLEILIIYS